MMPKAIVDGLLEADFDAANFERNLADNPDYDKWDAALENMAKLRELNVRKNDLLDELRYGIEIQRELARHRRDLKQVTGLIRVDYLTQGSPWKRRKEWPNTTGDEIVGANFEDGSHVMFTKPIKPFRRTTPRETKPEGTQSIPAIGRALADPNISNKPEEL